MKKIFVIAGCALLYGMACLPIVAEGQERVYTKSGTRVEAVPRAEAHFDGTKAAVEDATAGTFLVLSPPEWREVLRPLLDWKREQGFRVEWMAAEVRHRDTLRARLLDRYRGSTPLRPPQRYVLLVGDVDRIQSFVGQHTPSGLNSTPTDLYYGEYTGDYVPEALVGRLSVADSGELARVVRKIVAYEQGLLVTPVPQVLAVAGRESRTPAPTTTNGQVNYLCRLALRHNPPLEPVAHYNNDTAEDFRLFGLLRRPYGLVSYTGHGLRNGWQTPSFTAAMADTLTGFVPTVMINNCCLTSAFDGLCFGEQMLRSERGAVGVIGAGNETLWNEDYYWAVGAKYPAILHPDTDGVAGAFDTVLASMGAPYDAEVFSLGRMLYDGCRAVSLSGSVFDAYYWEVYNLLGDPSLVPMLGELDSLWVSVDSVEAGESRLAARVLPCSRVSVTADTLLLGSAVADSSGRVVVVLEGAIVTDSVTLTATRPQGRPCRQRVSVVRPRAGCLAVATYRTDSLLRVAVRNVGLEPAQRGFVILEIGGCTDSAALPELAAGGETEVTFALRDEWRGGVTAGRLTACADSLCTSLDIRIMAPSACRVPQIDTLRVLGTDGRPVKTLLPERQYHISVGLDAEADSLVAVVNGVRHCSPTRQREYRVPLALDAEYRAEARLEVFSACGSEQESFHLLGFRNIESFDGEGLGVYPWESAAPWPWHVEENAPEGRRCLRSAEMPDGMKSVLSIDVDVLTDDSISFQYHVSSEASDWLNFYVDGRLRGYWSGNTGWRRYARALGRGRHHLEWHYAKDGSVAEREDCARLDSICLPLCRWAEACGVAVVDSGLLGMNAVPAEGLRVYPNPADGHVKVEACAGCGVVLYDAEGRCMMRERASGGEAVFATATLSPGVYWVAVGEQGGVRIQKIVVIH